MRCRILFTLALIAIAATPAINAQWDIQNSGTTADLRGIASVGAGVAWASGTNGTVLRTEDGGYLWQRCTVPPDADKLDFRGIQAFDANTAIVMSSGTGDLSRLYKTTDGCQTWTLVFANPDKDGFWDALHVEFTPNRAKEPHPEQSFTVLTVAGDPVNGRFTLFKVFIHGRLDDLNAAIDIDEATLSRCENKGRLQLPEAGCFLPGRMPEPLGNHMRTPQPLSGEALFAASNSALIATGSNSIFAFVTGGASGPRFLSYFHYIAGDAGFHKWSSAILPLAHGDSAGAFSVAFNTNRSDGVVVGGDYMKPQEPFGTAAFTADRGEHWTVAITPPHGYRSAVAYDASSKTWITVGPNGTDISTDDGRNWRALKPTSTEPPDADSHWNALSLPFVVGPHGRIGLLNPQVLQPAAPKPTK